MPTAVTEKTFKIGSMTFCRLPENYGGNGIVVFLNQTLASNYGVLTRHIKKPLEVIGVRAGAPINRRLTIAFKQEGEESVQTANALFFQNQKELFDSLRRIIG